MTSGEDLVALVVSGAS